jgi:hypothetical protein
MLWGVFHFLVCLLVAANGKAASDSFNNERIYQERGAHRIQVGINKGGPEPGPRLTVTPMLVRKVLFLTYEGMMAVKHYDVVTISNWDKMHQNIFKPLESGNRELPKGLIKYNQSTMFMFEDKVHWKKWMHSIGLGDYVPITFTGVDTDIPYPIIVKMHPPMHWGKGVFAVYNSTMFQQIKDETAATVGASYMAEEALLGMGTSEVSMFGSVFQGELLSLRCLRFKFDAKNSKVDSNGLFVKGVYLPNKQSDERLIACSREMIDVARRMFQHLPDFTGPFCNNNKMDGSKHVKIIEVNARFCGSLGENDLLFLSTFVPLAVKMRNSGLYVGHSTTKQDWYSMNQKLFDRIVATEQRYLESGGGYIGDTWTNVDKFDLSKVLDGVSNSINEYNIQFLNKSSFSRKSTIKYF